MPKQPDRVDWHINHALIREAFVAFIAASKRAPTIAELAEKTDLGYGAVHRHLKHMKFDGRTSPAKMLTEDVLLGIANAARKGDSRNAKLFFQLLHSWVEPRADDEAPKEQPTLRVDFFDNHKDVTDAEGTTDDPADTPAG